MSEFPERLGSHYDRDIMLGRGGMGVVYRYRGVLRQYVAVKALPVDLADDPEWRERFLREAQLLAETDDHTNIALAYHLESQEGRTYLVMEYVPGETLADVIKARRLDLRQAIAICRQIADAIAAAHGRKVLHLDVKPRNVMVTPNSKVKLLDFGLACRWASGAQEIEEAATDLGSPGLRLGTKRTKPAKFPGGTPGYMSPEQYAGRVDRRSDIWSFGCVLYECLCGAAAFPGSDRFELRLATEEREPDFQPLALLPERVPESLMVLLRQCLCKDPQGRPPDMESIAQVLRSLESCLPEGAGRASHNLPQSLDAFIGRERELSELRELLSGNRLLTLHGIGGSGKTRLAVELARALAADGGGASRYADGTWLVELETIRDPGHLLPQLADVLIKAGALPPALRSAPLRAMMDVLRGRSMLLIIDNCERLHEAVRELLDQLLRGCPGIDVIATSRHALRAEGEQVWPTPGLSVPAAGATDPDEIAASEAVKLFLDRAARSCAGFELTPANAPFVAEICRKCEGWPFLVRLVGSAAGTRDVRELAAKHEQVLAHQEVVEARIGASIELLSPPERTLLGRLTVFRGRWKLEAAEEICGEGRRRSIRGEPVSELLSRLVGHSLVQFDALGGTGRYRMPDIVRVYARKKLLSERSVATLRKRHMEHFRTLSAEAEAAFNAGEQERSLGQIELEYDNLRAALEFATADGRRVEAGLALAVHLHRFWYVRNHYREGRQWLESLLGRREEKDVLQLRAHNALGIMAVSQGDFRAAEPAYQRGLEIARILGDRRREAGVLTNLGLLVEQTVSIGDGPPGSSQQLLEIGRQHLETAMSIYRDLSDDRGESWSRLNLAVIAKLQRRGEEAVELLEEALSAFVADHDDERIAAAKQNLGQISSAQGRFEQSIDLLAESLFISGKLQDVKTGSRTLLWLGVALSETGQRWRAAVLLAAGEALRSQLDAPRCWVDTVEVNKACGILEQELDVSTMRQAEALGACLSFPEAVAFVFEYLRRRKVA